MTSYRMVLVAAALTATVAAAPATFADHKQTAGNDQATNDGNGKADKHKDSKKHGKHKPTAQSNDQNQEKNKNGGEDSASRKQEKKGATQRFAPKVFGNQLPNGQHSPDVKKPAAVITPPTVPSTHDASKGPPPGKFSTTTQPQHDHSKSTEMNKPDHRKHLGKDEKNVPHVAPTKPALINPVPSRNAPKTGFAKSPATTPPKTLSAEEARKRFDKLRGERKEKVEAGGKVVIEEPGRRMFKQNNRLVIEHDETERLRKVAPHAHFQKGANGITISVIDRPGNVKIYSETDRDGQLIRRYRRGADGRDTIIIDNRRRGNHRRGVHGKDVATGIGIGLGVAAGAAILDSLVNVPEPHVTIPRDKYIVDYDDASEDDVYDALSAPPVGDFRDHYTLDEIRATASLRDRMRRVDLDDITFEFGSWEVDPGQYQKLDRIARAMLRVIRRNPNEVFLIEGYTDAVGSDEDNLSLSDRRAESVAEVLTEQFNVPFENLTTQGYGEEFLKVQTDGPERLNRRVAVRRITPLLARDGDAPPEATDGGGNDDSNQGYEYAPYHGEDPD